MRNPFFIGDNPALTETSGWVDAWPSRPSAYAVAAQTTADVVAAVNFAREHDLRLVVKGGGHSYQGDLECGGFAAGLDARHERHRAARRLRRAGCEATQAPQPAVSVEAGAMWMEAYDAVTTNGGPLRAGRRLHDGRRRRA